MLFDVYLMKRKITIVASSTWIEYLFPIGYPKVKHKLFYDQALRALVNTKHDASEKRSILQNWERSVSFCGLRRVENSNPQNEI